MKISICRRFRTKYFEVWDLSDPTNKFWCYLVLNDKDRSTDWSVNQDLKKMKEIEKKVGGESMLGDGYIKSYLFVNSKRLAENYKKDIYYFYDQVSHQIQMSHFLFVEEDKKTWEAVIKYLVKWGVDKNKLNPVNNPIYDHLSQD